ncbi:hypothetical protein KC322_g16382, partial [Hortaea werneckii]
MRRIIYGISLWAFLLAAALTISSIALPNWITYTAPTSDQPKELLELKAKKKTTPSAPAPGQPLGGGAASG